MIERIAARRAQRRQGIAWITATTAGIAAAGTISRVKGDWVRRCGGVRNRHTTSTDTTHLTVQMRDGHQRTTYVIVIVTVIIITIIRTTVTRVSWAHFVVGKLTTLDRH